MASVSAKKFPVLLRAVAQSRSCWPALFAIGGLNLLSLPLTLLYPLPLKIAVDSVLGSKALPTFLTKVYPHGNAGASPLLLAVGMVLAIAIVVNLQGLATWWLQTYTGEKLVWDFRARLLNHVQRLPLYFHDRYGTTESVYCIQHDAPAIQYIAIQGLIPLVAAFATLTGLIYVTMRIDASLALVALAIAPVLFLLTLASSRLVRQRSVTVKKLDSQAMSVIQEVLGCIRVIKAFGQEDREYARFVRRSDKRVSGQVSLAMYQAVFNMMIGFTIAGGTAIALYVGVQHVRAGILSVGSLLMVMAYIAQIYQPLQLLTTKITDLQAWLVSLERTFVLLDQEPEIAESPNAQSLQRARGDVDFRNASFQYGSTGRGLKNISFRIPAGSRVGIVGPTGAGKTTLLNLIMRFYDASDGEVLLDGVDLREYRISDLRQQFAVVLQEPILFDASIAENIAYGKRDASDEEIVAAAKSACAHDFIMSLSQQYESSVGERGSRLSGGERQRISLARAFLRDSPVLILDEPTSSVDVQTEDSILRATENLMEGRTTFMIAHRLNTLRRCNLILALKDGELVEVRSANDDRTFAAGR